MSRVVMIQCAVCGVEVERRGSRQKCCAECAVEKRRERDRAYYEANREKELERIRAYREANREKGREYSRAYREANREKGREYSRAYYEANREKWREYRRAYYKANRGRERERFRAYCEANPVAMKVRNRDRYRERTERYPGDPALRWQPWSVGEDAIALDESLSTAEVCELTGRSWAAVQRHRTRLKKKSAATCK